MPDKNILEESVSPHLWYAVRTFNCQEHKVSRFLTEKEWVHFIPMIYVQTAISNEGEEKKSKPILIPAVHNLLFIQQKSDEKEVFRILKECPVPVSVFRNPGEGKPCTISSRDMEELRQLCDPQYKTAVFMTQGEAEAMVGKDVRVVNGPFKGAVGRLVRKNKKFYFLKAVIGMGVMVRISRWYCDPI